MEDIKIIILKFEEYVDRENKDMATNYQRMSGGENPPWLNKDFETFCRWAKEVR